MIKIETLPLGTLKANCYLVWDDKTNKAVIIDPADEADFILQQIAKLELEPVCILVTHGHFDHNLASLELVLNLKIPFAASPEDQFLLDRLAKSAQHWLGITEVLEAPPITLPLKAEMIIKFGQLKLKTITTPGHTPGSVCFYEKKSETLFTGDTLFAGGVGRTDFKYSSPDELKKSTQEIFLLPDETTVYPGHGENTTIDEEKRNRA